MSGENARSVLGDVTNRPLKRRFSLISGQLGHKSGDGYVQNLAREDGDSNFTKQVCLGVENLVKEKCTSTGSISNKYNDVKDTIANSETAKDDDSRKSCESSEGGITIGVTQSQTATCDGLVSHVFCGSNEKDLGVGSLALSKHGSVEWSRLPISQTSRSFELEKCTALKGDSCANMSAGADLLKACSCSFCLTAAYIWSDLHYQDIKGRIAALKKSQKEACFLVQKNEKGKDIDTHSRGTSNKSAKLELDLLGHWRSLFLQMEDMFVRESSQLQASFVALKDLRENCKVDLERSTGMPSDQH